MVDALTDKRRDEITNKHLDEKEELTNIITAMEKEFEEADSAIRQEFQDMRDDIKSSNAEEFSLLRAKLDSKIQSMEREFEQVHLID